MTLAPREQRALLKLERSLRADPAVNAALRAFRCQCWRGTDPAGPLEGDLSPWHPVLWRAELLALITLSLSFVVTIAVLTYVAL